MFPQLRERIGPALDLIVEFSTLGEYRLNADGVLCAASALAQREHPALPDAQRSYSPECEPQMGGAGAPNAARAAVSRIVAGAAAGTSPAASPAARRPSSAASLTSKPTPRRPACDGKPALAPEQLCLAV